MDLVSRLDAAEQLFESPTNFSCPESAYVVSCKQVQQSYLKYSTEYIPFQNLIWIQASSDS